MLENLDSLAAALGVLAPAVFVILLVGILAAQLFLVDQQRRHARHLTSLVQEQRVRGKFTAERLQHLMAEYENALDVVGDPGRKQTLDQEYALYRRRQESAIFHLEKISADLDRARREEPPTATVAHQVLDYFANQQAVR
jgi:hypothetical protein